VNGEPSGESVAEVIETDVVAAKGDFASVITLKPAIRYQFKTGQRDWPET